MAGRRALTVPEERQLLRVLRKSRSRDRAMITTQWLTGFRIGEVLSLTLGDVLRHGRIVPKIGIGPRHLKGHYGRTRWIPVLPELGRALRAHLDALPGQYSGNPGHPLFPSRQRDTGGRVRPLGRSQAHAGRRRTTSSRRFSRSPASKTMAALAPWHPYAEEDVCPQCIRPWRA